MQIETLTALLAIAALWISAAVVAVRHVRRQTMTNIRRQLMISRLCLTTLIGALLIGLGFELEPALYSVGTQNDPTALYRLQAYPFNVLLDLILKSVLLGIPISLLATVLSDRQRQFRKKLAYSCMVVVACLFVFDTVSRLTEDLIHPDDFGAAFSPNRFLFSLTSDLFGGAAAGVALAFASSRVRKLLDRTTRAAKKEAKKVYRSAGIVLVSIVGVYFTVLSATYFLVIYRFSQRVQANVASWERVYVRYPDSPISASRISDSEDRAFEFEAIARHTSVRLSQQRSIVLCAEDDACPDLSVVYRSIEASQADGLDANRLPGEIGSIRHNRAEHLFKQVREIVLSPEVREVHIAHASKRSLDLFTSVYLPIERYVYLTKRRSGVTFLDTLLDLTPSKERPFALVVDPDGATLSLSTGMSTAMMLVFSPDPDLDSFWSRSSDLAEAQRAAAAVRVTFIMTDGKSETIDGTSILNLDDAIGHVRNLYLPGLEVRVMRHHGSMTLTGVTAATLNEPRLSFLQFGMVQSDVSEWGGDDLSGNMKVGNDVWDLASGDRVFFGAARLRVSDADEDSMVLRGTSSYIWLNGDILNESVLSLVPAEVTAVLVSVIFAFALGNIYGRRTGTWRIFG